MATFLDWWNAYKDSKGNPFSDEWDPDGFIEDFDRYQEENPIEVGSDLNFNNANGKNPSINLDGSHTDSALSSWFRNALTGDRDFARQVYLQTHQQQFNSAEAAKAFERQITLAQNSTLWQAEQLRQLGVNPAWAIAGNGGHGLNGTVSTAPTATSAANSAGTSGAQFGATLASLGQLVINAASLAAKANTPVVRYFFNTK